MSWPIGFARDTPSILGSPRRVDVCYHTMPGHAYYQFGVDYYTDADRDAVLDVLRKQMAKSMARDGHDPAAVIWGRLPLPHIGGEYF
jgi:hypothetical protein